MRRRICLVLLVGLFVSLGVSAADTRRWRDGSKAAGPLDIASISHGHRIGPTGVPQLVHTVRLHRAWPVEKLKHKGFVHLDFDRRGHPDGPQERSIWIVFRNGHLIATMYNTLGDPPKRLARVALWRPDWRTVKVAFPKTLLKRRSLDRYKWKALSYVENGHRLCPERDGCFDFAPNPQNHRTRYVKHVL